MCALRSISHYCPQLARAKLRWVWCVVSFPKFQKNTLATSWQLPRQVTGKRV